MTTRRRASNVHRGRKSQTPWKAILLMVLGVFLLESIHVLTLEESVYAQDSLDPANMSLAAYGDSPEAARLPGTTDQKDDDTVRIVALYGPRTLRVGELANFRARIANGSEKPVIYRWSFGDGRLGEGNNVSHRYLRSGRYRIAVTARNKKGSDKDSLTVIVEGDSFTPIEPVGGGAEPDEVKDGNAPNEATLETRRKPARTAREAAFRGTQPISWTEGGYTLLVATSSERDAAETIGVDLRRRGLRAGIYLDESGIGAPVYRVVVGQFAEDSAAARVRQELLADGYRGAFLVQPLPRH